MAIRAAVPGLPEVSPPLGVDTAAVARGVHARQPVEKRDELRELVLVEGTAQELADLPGVRLRGLAKLVAPGLGQDRIADAVIARAHVAGDETVALEPVEQPCHTAGGE